MIIDIRELSGGPVLSGAINGKSLFVKLLDATALEPEGPIPLVMDFGKVEVATASFLRESVFALKSYMRTIGSDYYPVVANINDAVRDELSVLTEAKNDAIMTCELDVTGRAANPVLVGSLDPKQELTFGLVVKLNVADANSLMEKFGDAEKTKSTTAWNNRLAALVARGVVREFSQGRAKFYRPLFEEAM